MPERFKVVCLPYKALYKCSDLPLFIYSLPATHTRIIPAFTAHPQGVTALCRILIALTHEGMARLS